MKTATLLLKEDDTLMLDFVTQYKAIVKGEVIKPFWICAIQDDSIKIYGHEGEKTLKLKEIEELEEM